MDEYVKREDVENIVAGMMAVMGQLTITVSAYGLALRKSGLLSPELWNECLDSEQNSEWKAKLEAALSKIHRNSGIEDLLRSFEGPPQ
jgi:hypothetical protein